MTFPFLTQGIVPPTREQLPPYYLGWTDWTPQLYQNGNLTSTISYARYAVVGRIAFVWVHLTCTAAGAAGNQIEVRSFPAAVPFPASGNINVVGSGGILDSGTAFYSTTVVALTASSVRFMSYGTAGWIGGDPSFALANTDQVGFTLTYQF